MKKLLSLSLFTAYSLVSMAQLPVSTTAENKNAVLEEFTGIYCVYCPDGHARAQAFHDQNPGDVVLINIHTGGYANPQSGDPDFRTNYGASIAGQTNLAGYPAGTINRREFTGMQQSSSGTAMSRGDWATAGAIVIGESSYANIAIEGDIDYAAKTLTVDVETYFTGTAPGSTVKLNVAVLQSNIEGPQTGASSNPSQVLPNGNYVHNHMLRDLLTGQWGIDIPTTTGVVNSYTYTWNIPTDINGVPVSMGDLEIAAFIAETQQTIVTGTTGPITFTLPAGVSTADVEAVNSMTIPAGYCGTDIAPEFTIKNNESFALDSVEAILTFNGSQVSQWVTNVPANGTSVVTFPNQTLILGANNMGFQVSVDNVYKYFDASTGNNNVAGAPVYKISSNVSNFPVAADFENDASYSAPSGFLIDDDTENIFALDKSGVNGLSTPLGGYLQSETSVLFYLGNMPTDHVASMISEKISLSGATSSEVQFDYSYAMRGSISGEELNVYISGDCGQSWIRIFDGTGGQGLETAPASASNQYFFPSSPSNWKTISANIASANGAEILVKFEGKSKGGNLLFIDNIMVDGNPIGIAEMNVAEEAKVYPNPASENVFVELAEATDFSLELTNTAGQVVKMVDFSNVAKAELNISDLPKGIYILNIDSDKGSSSQRITIAD